jgi:hypothetical protein
MLQVAYNGILMQASQPTDWVTGIVYEGPDQTVNRSVLVLDGLINPEATSYTGTPGPALPNLAAAGGAVVAGAAATAPPASYWSVTAAPASPLTSKFFIEQQLLQPRRALYISMPGSTPIWIPESMGPLTPAMLNNLAGTYAPDARNGPIPHEVRVTEVIGTKTFRVRFTVEYFTVINPSTSPNIVLSHRWTQSDEVDWEKYLTRRTTTGKIICRSDLLSANGVVVDHFRDSILPPRPNNTQRTSVKVTASSDGTFAEYTVVDEERMLLFEEWVIQQGVTGIDVSHICETSRPDVVDVLVPIASSTFHYAGAGASAGSVVPFLGTGAGGYYGARLGTFLGVIQQLPRAIHTVTCVIKGSQISLRKQLERLGVSICLQRLSQTAVQIQPGGALTSSSAAFWIQVEHNCTDKEVIVQMRAKSGIGALFDVAGSISNQIYSTIYGNILKGGGTLAGTVGSAAVRGTTALSSAAAAALFRFFGRGAPPPAQPPAPPPPNANQWPGAGQFFNQIVNQLGANLQGDVGLALNGFLMPDLEYGLGTIHPYNDGPPGQNFAGGDLPQPPSTRFDFYSGPGAVQNLPIPGFLAGFGASVQVPIPAQITTSAFAGAHGSRGTLLQSIITQALTVPHYAPPPAVPTRIPAAQNISVQ